MWPSWRAAPPIGLRWMCISRSCVDFMYFLYQNVTMLYSIFVIPKPQSTWAQRYLGPNLTPQSALTFWHALPTWTVGCFFRLPSSVFLLHLLHLLHLHLLLLNPQCHNTPSHRSKVYHRIFFPWTWGKTRVTRITQGHPRSSVWVFWIPTQLWSTFTSAWRTCVCSVSQQKITTWGQRVPLERLESQSWYP